MSSLTVEELAHEVVIIIGLLFHSTAIEIGFEYGAYTFTESDGLQMVHLIKSIESEQTFEIVIGSVAAGSRVPDALNQVDYSLGLNDFQQFEFSPSDQWISICFVFYDDAIPEGTEVFRLISLQTEGSVAYFNPSEISTVTVFIEDDGDGKPYYTIRFS